MYNLRAKNREASSELDETSKVLIKTEIEEDYSVPEDIFVDCTTLLSSNDLKVEVTEPLVPRTRTAKKKKESEFNDEEHRKLLDEFKAVLKQRRDKK